jgi:hypothetical protein
MTTLHAPAAENKDSAITTPTAASEPAANDQDAAQTPTDNRWFYQRWFSTKPSAME